MVSRLIRAREKGLSLIEICMASSVVSILTCMTLPSFQSMLALRQLEGVANELWHDLQYVRASAISLNQNIQFQLQTHPSGINCYVIHTGNSGDCICQTTPLRAVCNPGSRALKTVILPISRIQLSATRHRLSWSSNRGTVSPSATFRISSADGRSIVHVINIHGRVRTCSPDGRVKGIPRC
jgi:type IV fimbrial biogenesis protein FimT